MSWRTDGLSKAIAELKGAVSSLHTALRGNGGNLSDKDGLAAMTTPIQRSVIPAGRPVDAIVAATHTVYPGDMVRWCHEVIADGDSLRIALEGVKILAAKELRLKGKYGGAIIAYTQEGYTKLKTVYIKDDNMTLGPTLTLSEDEAVELVLGTYEQDHVFAFWTDDAGTSYSTRAACYDAIDGVLKIGDEMLSAAELEDAPRNLAISHATQEDPRYAGENYSHDKAPRAVVSYTVGESAWVNSIAYFDGEIIAGTAQELGGLMDADYDVYSQAWGVAYSADALYITYPQKGKTNYQALKILGAWNEGRNTIRPGNVMQFTDHSVGVVTSPFGCAVQTAAVYPCREWDHGTILAHGVTRLSAVGGKIKSSIGISTWAAGVVPEVQPDPPDGEDPICNHHPSVLTLSSGETDAAFGASIGRVGLSDATSSTTILSYCRETTMCAIPITWTECSSIGGNEVAVGSFEDFGTVLAISDSEALFVSQRDGAAYVKLLKIQSVVIPTDAASAEGVAVRGGSGGTSIPVRRST